MRVVLVEDDYLEAGQIRDVLNEQYARVDLVEYATELDFVAALPTLGENPPDLVIMDVMLPRQRASTNVVAPPEERRGEPLRSGIRLLAKLQQSAKLRGVPVIIHSALPWQDLETDLFNRPDHVIFVQKSATSSQLMVVVRAVLGALGRLPAERGTPLRARILEALELSPGIGGLSLDVKKLFAAKRTRD
jgi:CheY-like chemotaxis protein